MSAYRTRNRLLLVEVEGTSGTPETPTVGANAVRGEGFAWRPQFDVEQTNEHTGTLDAAAPVPGRGFAEVPGEFLLKGSGSAGTAPEYGPILRAGSMSETLTATDIDDTAQAGGASTITLHSGASATDDAYVGMVLTLNGGTGSGQTRVIAGYVGSTKVATVTPAWSTPPDATSDFIIHANALYVPASEDLETVTAWLYDRSTSSALDAIRQRIHGAASTIEFAIATGRIGRLRTTLRGIITGLPDAVTDPGDGSFQSVRAQPFIGADAFLDDVAIRFRDFSLSLGSTVAMPDDPAATFGYDTAGVVGRRLAGGINPRTTDLATYDAFADFIGATQRRLWLRWGATAGNRLSLYCPAIQPTQAPPGDTDGYRNFDVQFEAVGQDDGVYLCVY